MSTTIDQSFVMQFESDVHLAYCRMGSKLRNTVRIKTGVKGKSTTFQKVGAGVAGEKARHGQVPIMDLMLTLVKCLLQDRYAGEHIEDMDELKVNRDEKVIAAESGAAAVGRKSDDIVLDALEATNSANGVAVGSMGDASLSPHFPATRNRARPSIGIVTVSRLVARAQAADRAEAQKSAVGANGLTKSYVISIMSLSGSLDRRALDVGHCGSKIGGKAVAPALRPRARKTHNAYG
jgi:hypothetical protein